MSYISFKYQIIIDRMIGTPGHGKDLIDGINTSNKRYLKDKMCMIRTPEADDCSKRIKVHSMIVNTYYSLQMSARGYVNGLKERMEQMLVVSKNIVKINVRKTKVVLCTKQE